MQAAKALVGMRNCAGSAEPLLHENAISIKISCAGSNSFVCLILFFTSTQQSFSYAGRFFLGLTSTKLG